MAGRFSAQMSSQMFGWPLAMRVMSRKPPAARRSSAACSSARSLARPISVAAVRCGTWLMTATTWSCRSAGRATTSAPSSATTAATAANVVSAVDARGRQHPHRSLEHAAVGAVEAFELAAGHRDGRRRSAGRRWPPSTAPFTLPTSVTRPDVSARARFTWSASVSTGVATKVISASGSRPVAWTMPSASACSMRSGRWSSPVTCQPALDQGARDGASDEPEARDVGAPSGRHEVSAYPARRTGDRFHQGRHLASVPARATRPARSWASRSGPMRTRTSRVHRMADGLAHPAHLPIAPLVNGDPQHARDSAATPWPAP